MARRALLSEAWWQQATSIPYLVGKERSGKAIAALLAADRTMNVVAPPLGGFLFTLGGPLPALIVNAFTYLISQLSLVRVPTMGPDEPGPLPSLHHIWSDIADGFRFIHRDTAMTAVVYCVLLLLFFDRMATTVVIPFAKIEFGASDLEVGAMFGAIAVGSIAGSLLGGATVRKWPFGPVVFWTVTGMGGGFEAAQIISWRMRITPDEWIGRVFAAVRFIFFIGAVPGTLLGGWLADVHGPRLPITISAFGFLIVAFGAAALPAIRRDRR